MPEEGAISRAPGSKKPRVKASSARSNAKDDLSIEMVFRVRSGCNANQRRTLLIYTPLLVHHCFYSY